MKELGDQNQKGIALFSVISAIAVLFVLLSVYQTITKIELSSNYSSIASKLGFFAGEAGLNIRAEEIRQKFLGYNRPTGTSPSEDNPCSGSNNGSGDFICKTHEIQNSKHIAQSYVIEEANNPVILSIPTGERYQGLNAQEYQYSAISKGLGPENQVESILELKFKSRLVPLFQFAAFYNKDLEILPGPSMTLEGPVHTNGQLYLDTGNQLRIDGQVTAAKEIYRGRKNDSSCQSRNVQIRDPNSYRTLVNPCSSRTLITSSMTTNWNGMIQQNVPTVEVPSVDMLLPTASSVYWSKADVRLVLKLLANNSVDTSKSSIGVEVTEVNGSINTTGTTSLAACTGSIGESPSGSNNGKAVQNTATFYNNREAKYIRMLEIDLRNFLDCLRTTSFFGKGLSLTDDTEGGLVFYFTVSGPQSNSPSSGYGIRIRNAAEIRTRSGLGGTIKGLTIVSDQAIYTMGHYNSTNKKPAAILADSYNILSTNWGTNDNKSTQNLSNRTAAHTTVNTALLAGTDTTGNVEGNGGQGGAYNGGLENYPRFHENWTGRTLTYYGSFVSLSKPLRSSGNWLYGNPQYEAPNRDWHYDTSFNDAANLPPITPRFVYLRQQLFHRDFEQE